MAAKRVNQYVIMGVAVFFLAAGCSMGMQNRHSSSVVNYLYPNNQNVVDQPATPVLSLPLKVGVAFVPEESGRYASSVLSEQQRMELMNRIAAEFRKEPFVQSIDIIPSTYLIPQGSFTNIDQLQTMYGIDVIVLLSYDQVQHTDEGFSSIWYWTLVGAYVVKGEENSTNTMLDAAVYDIRSRKMLFRAPGTSYIEAKSTPIELGQKLREDSYDGFEAAAGELVVNLQAELERFKTRIKETPEDVKVVETEKYKQRKARTGGGSIGWPFTALVIGLSGAAVWLERRRRG